jgi:hypothetical protein
MVGLARICLKREKKIPSRGVTQNSSECVRLELHLLSYFLTNFPPLPLVQRIEVRGSNYYCSSTISYMLFAMSYFL